MKKGIRITLIVVLSIILLAVIVVGSVALRGVHGHGPLNFLCYLVDPGPITESEVEATESDFSVCIDGDSIRGKVFIPIDGLKKREVLVFSHGFVCPAFLLEKKATAIARSGVATMIFDFRGGSTAARSDGSPLDLTLDRELADVGAVVDYAKKLDWVDTTRIFLMGESFGGMVSALAAAQRDDIRGAVLCFPALFAYDNAHETFADINDIPETEEPEEGEYAVGKEFWESLWNTDVMSIIPEYKGPVLILHGTADKLAPISYSYKADSLYTNSELHVFKGAGHCFAGKDAKKAYRLVHDFVKRNNEPLVLEKTDSIAVNPETACN